MDPPELPIDPAEKVLKDIYYKVDKIVPTYASKAGRRAVFWTLDPDSAYHTVCQSLSLVRKLWQHRLQTLVPVLWQPVRTEKGLWCLRNCPPTGVMTKKRGRKPCDRARVCPFCYIRRYIMPAYYYLERFLFDGRKAKPEYYGRPCLVTFIKRYLIEPTKARNPWSSQFVQDVLCGPTARLPWILLDRREEVEYYGARAAVVMHRIDPQPGYLLVDRCGILVTTERRVLRNEDFRTEKAKYLTVKRELAKIVGDTFFYPPGMMHTDAAIVATVLDSLHKRRLFATYGPQAARRA